MPKHDHVLNTAAAGLAAFFLCFPGLDAFLSASQDDFEKGKVIEKVVCRDSSGQSYALYLPRDSSVQVKRPVLFLFDPSAQGSVAVEVFRPAAEKFGWILIASNNSRNGPQEPNLKAARTVFQDSMARLPIDEKRIYTGGFSGGARVASVFPLAVKRRIAGIIGIGAGISTGVKIKDIGISSYFGIVGLSDFNYPEMKRMDEDLDGVEIPHRILFYEAPHRWPDLERCLRALGWMEITAMNQGLRDKDEALIEDILGNELDNAATLTASKKMYWAARQYEAVSTLFDGLRDSSKYAAEADRLKRSREYIDFIKKEINRDERYASLRQDFTRACTLVEESPEDRAGFNDILRDLRLGSLKKEAKEAGTGEDRSFAFRVLFSFSLSMGERGLESYTKNDWLRASSYYKLAAEACLEEDPRLKFIYVNLASMASLLGEVKTALKYLETALDKGFSDFRSLENDEDLEKIRNTAGFRELLKRIKKIS